MRVEECLYPLFSVPFYMTSTGVGDFEKEVKYLESLPYTSNPGNLVTATGNLFKEKKLSRLKKLCKEHLDIYIKNVVQYDHEFYITHVWGTKTEQHGYHHPHSHANSLFSGVIYLKVPGNSSKITLLHRSCIREGFSNFLGFKTSQYNTFNSETWTFDVKEGDIIIFPSWLTHEVSVHQHPGTRYVIGFNTWVKGTIAQEDPVRVMNFSGVKDE